MSKLERDNEELMAQFLCLGSEWMRDHCTGGRSLNSGEDMDRKMHLDVLVQFPARPLELIIL